MKMYMYILSWVTGIYTCILNFDVGQILKEEIKFCPESNPGLMTSKPAH